MSVSFLTNHIQHLLCEESIQRRILDWFPQDPHCRRGQSKRKFGIFDAPADVANHYDGLNTKAHQMLL